MTIETKFNVGDTVYFTYDGVYRSGIVNQIDIHINACSGFHLRYKVKDILDTFRCEEQELSFTLEEAIQAQEEADRELEESIHRATTER